MKDYIKSITKVNELILTNCVDSSEIERFSKSELRWATKKTMPFNRKGFSKGQVYQFEFGKNYVPEMSYEHRGLIIGIKQQLLYVLPIYTYKSEFFDMLYNTISNPTGTLLLLEPKDCPFLKHTSVLKLNDLRTVSTKRALYQQHDGFINCNSKLYKLIERLAFKTYFPSIDYELNQIKEELDKKDLIIKQLQAKIENLSN